VFVVGYREALRRLTINDPRFLDAVFSRDESASGPLDARTTALVRLAALVASDGPGTAFAHAASLAIASGATEDEIVEVLVAVAPVVGSARAVTAAPKVALGLGYDVEADLEAWPELDE
jgi:4-carboxymuconolactone decarboxylase